jgi:aminomethyltransferase
LKHTPLYELHKKLGAKFGPFAGYEMPLFYPAGILGEHQHTRRAAGLFDISHMVHVVVAGPKAAALVERLCPYPANEQQSGVARYTFFLNDNAGIIDDLIVTRLGEHRYRIVCNAGCADKDVAHIRHHAPEFGCDSTVVDCAFLALQGPAAERQLANAGHNYAELSFLDAIETPDGWFVSRSGYTGEDGFEIALPATDAVALAERLLGDPAVLMIGLGARDSLRLEAGLSLYGQDLDEETDPRESGLLWAIPKSHRQGGNFIGAAALATRLAAPQKLKRVGLRSAQPVRAGVALFEAAGRGIGKVTSGGFGPTVGHPVAMARIEAEAEPPFTAEVRGRKVAVEPAALPFVPRKYKRA